VSDKAIKTGARWERTTGIVAEFLSLAPGED